MKYLLDLLKEGKDPKDVRSYRPVALTNIFSNIFERMTNKRLAWYLEKKKKINERQFGFRKHKSIIDVISKILDGFQKKKKTTVIYFNIKKAYNKINKYKTFKPLEKMEILRELISNR